MVMVVVVSPKEQHTCWCVVGGGIFILVIHKED